MDGGITDLPRIYVVGNFELIYTTITQFPIGFKVPVDHYLTGTAVRSIPTSARIGGKVIGLPTMAEKHARRKDSGPSGMSV